MKARILLAICVSTGALASAGSAYADGLPTRIGKCVETRVTQIQDDSADKGSAVRFENGGVQISSEQVPEVDESRPGDLVTVCLVTIPKGCPKGDDRGREFRTTNKRTGKSWTLPNSHHGCGGA